MISQEVDASTVTIGGRLSGACRQDVATAQASRRAPVLSAPGRPSRGSVEQLGEGRGAANQSSWLQREQKELAQTLKAGQGQERIRLRSNAKK